MYVVFWAFVITSLKSGGNGGNPIKIP